MKCDGMEGNSSHVIMPHMPNAIPIKQNTIWSTKRGFQPKLNHWN